jgi:hypothetical protein
MRGYNPAEYGPSRRELGLKELHDQRSDENNPDSRHYVAYAFTPDTAFPLSPDLQILLEDPQIAAAREEIQKTLEQALPSHGGQEVNLQVYEPEQIDVNNADKVQLPEVVTVQVDGKGREHKTAIQLSPRVKKLLALGLITASGLLLLAGCRPADATATQGNPSPFPASPTSGETVPAETKMPGATATPDILGGQGGPIAKEILDSDPYKQSLELFRAWTKGLHDAGLIGDEYVAYEIKYGDALRDQNNKITQVQFVAQLSQPYNEYPAGSLLLQLGTQATADAMEFVALPGNATGFEYHFVDDGSGRLVALRGTEEQHRMSYWVDSTGYHDEGIWMPVSFDALDALPSADMHAVRNGFAVWHQGVNQEVIDNDAAGVLAMLEANVSVQDMLASMSSFQAEGATWNGSAFKKADGTQLWPAEVVGDVKTSQIVVETDESAKNQWPNVTNVQWNDAFHRGVNGIEMTAQQVWKRASLLSFAWKLGINGAESMTNDQLAEQIAGQNGGKVDWTDPFTGQTAVIDTGKDVTIVVVGYPPKDGDKFICAQPSKGEFDFGFQITVDPNGQMTIHLLDNVSRQYPYSQSAGNMAAAASAFATLGNRDKVQISAQGGRNDLVISTEHQRKAEVLRKLLGGDEQSGGFPLWIFNEHFTSPTDF